MRTVRELVGLAVDVVDGDLGLGVGAQVREDPRLANLGEALGQTMGEVDGRRHHRVVLVARVTEHHPLVAGALVVDLVDSLAGTGLEGLVDALRDVGALRVDRGHHATRVAVEPHRLAVVADLLDRATHDVGDLDVGRRRDLARDDRHAGRHHGLAGHAGHRIVGEDRVEDGVGDLIGHLVGMPLRDRLGGEGEVVHSFVLLMARS